MAGMDGFLSNLWQWYLDNHDAVQPLLAPVATLLGAITTLAVGIFLAFAALRQAKTATSQAETASNRHIEQTLAEKQRRITESFAKATEQLGSDKIEARLGGIYTLERISKESPDDYWTVMEILTALVRVRAHWEKPDANTVVSEGEKSTPPLLRLADIASIMTVLMRRKGLKREVEEGWQLDLKGVDLRGWVPSKVHLAGADLTCKSMDFI